MRNTGSAWTPSTITGGSCLVIQPLWQRLEEAVLETNLGAEDDRNSEACLKMSMQKMPCSTTPSGISAEGHAVRRSPPDN